MSSNKKKGLGKGLSALLENVDTDITSNNGAIKKEVVGAVAEISIEDIETNPFQPRTTFEKEALIELSNSIKTLGIIQPITVRKLGRGKYQLISGERRFRASQIAGLEKVPAYIRIANDQAMLEMALVENIQRENLDSIEVALSYQRLIDECNLKQEELGQQIGKSRSSVANHLRLLKLPAIIQLAIRNREISMGHARALVSVEDETEKLNIFKLITTESLSVRQTEELVKKPKAKVSEKVKVPSLSFQQQKIQDDLSSQLDTNVNIKNDTSGKGKLVINFNSEKDLNRIIDILDVLP